jgi:Rap1a immunity proteins
MEAIMHRHFLRAAILAGLLFPFSAASQKARMDVQALHQLCKLDQDLCLGYVSGVGDHMLLTGAFLRNQLKGLKEEDRELLTGLAACLPPKTPTSSGAMVQAFINWAEKHPENWKMYMHPGVILALNETWPCN